MVFNFRVNKGVTLLLNEIFSIVTFGLQQN